MTKINKEFFKEMDPKRHEELKNEISNLQAVDNKISEIIDEQETAKEKTIKIEKASIEYHTLKVSDLPMYKQYEGYKCKWYYRLDVIKGKQRCIKIVDDEVSGMRSDNVSAESILDGSNKNCSEHEWILVCAKLLNYITPNANPSITFEK